MHLSRRVSQQLCDIYLQNVDPVFKILHRPSIQLFLRDGGPYLDYEPSHEAPATLASAIYFAAVCTLDDAQCSVLFGTEKKILVQLFQKECEAALAKADLATSDDLAVLQAYVISLVSPNSHC